MKFDSEVRPSVHNARARTGCIPVCRMAVVVLLLTLPLEATQQNYRLCFPQVVGVPVLTPGNDPCGNPLVAKQPPIIDGCVTGDPGWTGAFRYVFENGTQFPKAAVQGIADGMFLYLSFEVFNDMSYDDNDIIILTFSPSNNGTDDRRLHIYPNSSSGPRPDGSAPRKVDYWTNSGTWNNAGAAQSLPFPHTDTFTAAVRNVTVGPNDVNWFVEVRIRLADFDLLASPFFGLYFDVIPIGGGFAPQYYWPSRSSAGGSNGIPGNILANPTLVDTSTPVPSNWGNGTLNAPSGQSCAGVSLNWLDIKSNHLEDQICTAISTAATCSSNKSNIFTATPSNNSIDARDGMTPIAANNVTATFSVANFGLPAEWTPVPVGSPQGSGGTVTLNASCTDVPGPNTCASLQTSAWNITSSDPNLGNYMQHPDQCILVDLDVVFPSTSNCIVDPTQCVSFLNKSARRNMWVLTASEVSKTAEISAKGYPPHSGHKTQQEFRLRVLQREEVVQPGHPDAIKTSAAGGRDLGNTPSEREGKVLSRLSWSVEGCRLTGEYIRIKEQKLETCDDVGAFGAVVNHFGKLAVARWHVDLEGPGLSRVADAKNIYRIIVPQDQVATIQVKFAPEEKSAPKAEKIAVFLDAGAGVPHGTFGNAFNTGFSLNAGLEYIATSQFSVEGIFGFHDFPAKVGSSLDLYQFSANGKFYLTSGGPFRPFVNGGIGGYDFTPGGGTHFGGNVGAGVLREFGPHWGLQASYNFHAVNTPGAATKFSTIQGGIRFVF